MDNISDIRYCAVPPWPGDTDTGYRHIALSRVRHNQTKWDREERRIHKPPEPPKQFACVAQCNLFIRSEIICHSFTMDWSIWGRKTDWWHKRFKSHKRICVLLSSLSVFFIESNFSITPGLVLLSVLIASFYLLPFVRDNRLLALNFPTNINKLGPKPHISGSWHLTWEENIILDEQFYDLLK